MIVPDDFMEILLKNLFEILAHDADDPVWVCRGDGL